MDSAPLSQRALRYVMGITSLCSAAAVALHAAPAAACSVDAGADIPRCTPARFDVADDAILAPAAPGVPLSTGDATTFEIVTEAGEPVPSDLQRSEWGDTILVPRAPLAPETAYRVRYVERCLNPQQGLAQSGEERSWAFRTSADAPMPTEVGYVTVQTDVKMLPVTDSCGGSIGEVRAAVARLSLLAAAELRPYLSIAHLSAKVQGTTIGFGPPLRATAIVVALGELVAHCDGSGALEPDKHTVTVSARIPGATTQPAPVELVVDLRCDVSKPADDLVATPPVAPTDGGAAAEGADSTRDARADAGASEEDGAATAVSAPTRTEQESASAQQSDDAAGCAIQQAPARRAPLDGVWWLLLGALLHRARRGRAAARR